jgi:hypothetical protein
MVFCEMSIAAAGNHPGGGDAIFPQAAAMPWPSGNPR